MRSWWNEVARSSEHIAVPLLQRTAPILPHVRNSCRAVKWVSIPGQTAKQRHQVLACAPQVGRHSWNECKRGVLPALYTFHYSCCCASPHMSRIAMESRQWTNNSNIKPLCLTTPILKDHVRPSVVIRSIVVLLHRCRVACSILNAVPHTGVGAPTACP